MNSQQLIHKQLKTQECWLNIYCIWPISHKDIELAWNIYGK